MNHVLDTAISDIYAPNLAIQVIYIPTHGSESGVDPSSLIPNLFLLANPWPSSL